MNTLNVKNKQPIFIHSLFRAGSTYIFKKFRENNEAYTCYQEPVHEIAIQALGDHEILNQDTGNKKNDQLRHPLLKQSYFYELYNIADKALPYLKKEDIYNNYFDNNVNSLCKYLTSLVENSVQRCVIQECRLTSRMSAIRENMSGIHLYLWRNPWDQWWSYKVTDYFDTANLLILKSNKSSEVIKAIAKKLNVPEYYSENILEEFHFYRNHRLGAEDSYFLFYSIWFVSLIESRKNADLIFNIDKLSVCDSYKEHIANKLCDLDILGVNFKDCRVPQCTFADKDIDFFTRIEKEVFKLFLATGFDRNLLNETINYRNEFTAYSLPSNEDLTPSKILQDSERARALSRNYMDDISAYHEQFAIEKKQISDQAALILADAEARVDEAKLIAKDAEARANASEVRIMDMEAHVIEVEAEAKARVNSVLQSSSWRITKPFRWIMLLTLSFKIRVKSMFVKVAHKVVATPVGFIKKHPRLKRGMLKVINKNARLEQLARKMLMGKKQASILSDRGDRILNEINRAKES